MSPIYAIETYAKGCSLNRSFVRLWITVSGKSKISQCLLEERTNLQMSMVVYKGQTCNGFWFINFKCSFVNNDYVYFLNLFVVYGQEWQGKPGHTSFETVGPRLPRALSSQKQWISAGRHSAAPYSQPADNRGGWGAVSTRPFCVGRQATGRAECDVAIGWTAAPQTKHFKNSLFSTGGKVETCSRKPWEREEEEEFRFLSEWMRCQSRHLSWKERPSLGSWDLKVKGGFQGKIQQELN